jgi:hypothetical protein
MGVVQEVNVTVVPLPQLVGNVNPDWPRRDGGRWPHLS